METASIMVRTSPRRTGCSGRCGARTSNVTGGRDVGRVRFAPRSAPPAARGRVLALLRRRLAPASLRKARHGRNKKRTFLHPLLYVLNCSVACRGIRGGCEREKGHGTDAGAAGGAGLGGG